MQFEHALLDRFLCALRALPDVRVDADYIDREIRLNDSLGDGQVDARIDLCVADQPITLLVEAKKAIYPRDVRQVLWQLKTLAQKTVPVGNRQIQSLLLAESISPGAKDLLRSERVGYFDEGGSLFLPARGAYLYIDKPPPKSLGRS